MQVLVLDHHQKLCEWMRLRNCWHVTSSSKCSNRFTFCGEEATFNSNSYIAPIDCVCFAARLLTTFKLPIEQQWRAVTSAHNESIFFGYFLTTIFGQRSSKSITTPSFFFFPKALAVAFSNGRYRKWDCLEEGEKIIIMSSSQPLPSINATTNRSLDREGHGRKQRNSPAAAKKKKRHGCQIQLLVLY